MQSRTASQLLMSLMMPWRSGEMPQHIFRFCWTSDATSDSRGMHAIVVNPEHGDACFCLWVIHANSAVLLYWRYFTCISLFFPCHVLLPSLSMRSVESSLEFEYPQSEYSFYPTSTWYRDGKANFWWVRPQEGRPSRWTPALINIYHFWKH